MNYSLNESFSHMNIVFSALSIYLSLKIFLAHSLFFAEFEPHILIKVILIKKCVLVNKKIENPD